MIKNQRKTLALLFAWGFGLSMLLGNVNLRAAAQSAVLRQQGGQSIQTTHPQTTQAMSGIGSARPPAIRAKSAVAPSRLELPGATRLPIVPGSQPVPAQSALPIASEDDIAEKVVGLPAQPPPADAEYLPDDFLEQLQSDRSSLINWQPSPSAANASEIRGVWMTTSDMATLRDQRALDQALEQLARLNFNTIYPVVWTRGYVTYESDVAKAAGIPQLSRGLQGQDLLADLAERAHRLGLSVIPWFEYGFMVPPQSEVALLHPEWLSKQRDGTQTQLSSGKAMAWLNPFKPEVQALLKDLAVDLVRHYDVDGIQFDDHMSLPKDFGYDDWTRSRYQSETGCKVPGRAVARWAPSSAAINWTQWRADQITYAMADLHRAVKSAQPNLILSISPNRYDFAYRHYLQDWKAWLERGLIDELIVQAYRRDQRDFVNDLRQPEIQQAKARIPTGIGILTGLRDRRISISQIKRQVRAAQSEGLGVSFFFYQSLWDNAPESVAERKLGFRSIFPEAVPRIAARL